MIGRFRQAVAFTAVSLAGILLLSKPGAAAQGPASAAQSIVVDHAFPGGNIVLDSIEGDTVSLHQDLRDTQGDWFYWCFRVRGAAGRRLAFTFTRGNPIGVLGPALSADAGLTWKWLGRDAAQGPTFRYSFAPDAAEVRFCFAIPYLEANLNDFIRRHARDPNLRTDVLCRTPKGRAVELLHLGRLDGKPDHRVLLTCRHHCCEMIASYALEGIMDEALAQSDDGRWLRGRVEFLIVPFMDKDGVEDGDQGKNRKPHDHNRDYAGESLYPAVRELRRMVPTWSRGRLDVALDLHCPFIRGPRNEDIYFVGGPEKKNWDGVGQFSAILEKVRTGPLVYRAENNLPYGQAWNVGEGQPRSFSRWAANLPGTGMASSIEIPYANASGTTVTAETTRAFGRDLARALRRFLEVGERNAEFGPAEHLPAQN